MSNIEHHGVSHLVVALGGGQRRLRTPVGMRVEKCFSYGCAPSYYFSVQGTDVLVKQFVLHVSLEQDIDSF